MDLNILIVDDSATTRAVIRKTIKLAGVKTTAVDEAADGCAALEFLADHEVHLVFADLNMPKMGGDELIRRMADDARFSHIPVIVVSTEGSQTRLGEILLPIVAGFIRKPFTPEQMRETILKVLEPVA
ncbi:MAG: response regulator [Pirellulales bacterium]